MVDSIDQLNTHWWKGKDNKTPSAGENGRTAKLDKEKVADIKRRMAEGEGRRSIAADYNVSVGTISRVNNGSRW